MELFVLVLILLACVIVSSVLAQLVPLVSLPLVQIGVGLIVALIVPSVSHIEVDPELFLVLFIAPLLFNEARQSNKRELWRNRRAIVSLAIGLVLATVLIVGFVLNAIVPSIPLAAAFALGAALGPTDAAAVASLGTSVNLTKRQKSLLSGESLINDASGVVSFQFAIAAAVTGTFSAVDAVESFAILFFGGIAAGIVMGFAARGGRSLVHRFGLEDTMVHVIYQVFTPFVVFLAAEAMHVSGILAVVAAGIVMAEAKPRLISTNDARNQMVANSVWEVIVFLINGVIFVLLGMQLPLAMEPTLAENASPWFLIGCILLITALVMLTRYAWVSVMELAHRDDKTGRRGIQDRAQTLRQALVTTFAGPKGAVTLSIILTIPLSLDSGAAFPSRDLLIFLTAGTILATLLIADFALPRLAPSDEGAGASDEEMYQGSVSVLTATIAELRGKIAERKHPEYEPATRLTIARYRTRLARERLEHGGSGQVMHQLIDEVLGVQQRRADELRRQRSEELQERGQRDSLSDSIPYYTVLPSIRASVGYFGKATDVGTRFHPFLGYLMRNWARLLSFLKRLKGNRISEDEAQQIYYETCLFAIELENAAIEYLEEVEFTAGTERYEAARVIVEEHRAALDSLKSRIGIDRDGHSDTPPSTDQVPSLSQQMKDARKYADFVDSGALEIELDKIRQLQESGEISLEVAKKLRENVYLFQMSIGN